MTIETDRAVAMVITTRDNARHVWGDCFQSRLAHNEFLLRDWFEEDFTTWVRRTEKLRTTLNEVKTNVKELGGEERYHAFWSAMAFAEVKLEELEGRLGIVHLL